MSSPQDPVPVIIHCSATAYNVISKIQINNNKNSLDNNKTVEICSLFNDESIISEQNKPDSINDSVNKNNLTDDIYGIIDHK